MLEVIKHIWRPGLEILILAVGIYYVFTFVRGTRGAAVVTGFLVVMLTLWLISRLLKLLVLTWLMGSITTFFVVAILVIFQPEIRRLLAQVGNFQFFSNVLEQRENIEVIIQTVERLAEVRIGALMAIEQATQIQGVVESGVPVDCVATPEMLETIFFPNNAMHDGGVILKGDRITFATCIFPLTRRLDLSKSLGTRHRAAIGLSEETDAIVIVVSEETGSISYAYRGQLTRGISAENLRAFLTAQLVKAERPKTFADWLRAVGTRRETAPATRASNPPGNAPAPQGGPGPGISKTPPPAPGAFRTGTEY